MKYYLIAGEASGDLHASNLIKALRKIDTKAEFRCLGGDLMREAGAVVHQHYRDVAVMGIIEVVKKLGVIRKHRDACRTDLLEYKPDVLILIDYSGFNLPMARFAAKNNIKVIYYISPKLWAWAQWRVKKVKEYVQKMFVILPFEVDFYKQHQVEAEYYGNPVLDSITEFEASGSSHVVSENSSENSGKPIIALLAGSRQHEISALLPEMLAIMPHYPDYRFIIAGAPAISPELYEEYTHGHEVEIVYNQTYNLLSRAVAAVVASGTATLETALLKVPEVVIYKVNPLSVFIGRFFVKVKFFSLVNLILDREAVKELFQKNLLQDIKTELDKILFDDDYRNHMLDDFKQLRENLGNPGAAGRVAKRIIEIIDNSALPDKSI